MAAFTRNRRRRDGHARIALAWDNYGPYHFDRLRALRSKIGDDAIGIQFHKSSDTYVWGNIDGGLDIFTLADGASQRPSGLQCAVRLIRLILSQRIDCLFTCHYERPWVFISALTLRMAGVHVFIMNDSKFDDYDRSIWREILKRMYHIPYRGGLAAGIRSKDYMRFLGVRPDSIELGYDSVSVDRLRTLAAVEPAPGGRPHDGRHFVIIARWVAKKNIITALQAYALYAGKVETPRPLVLCGYGELEGQIRRAIADLGLGELVDIRGAVDARGVCEVLANALALLLPSTEEQFGLVVVEAQALGVPVIVSQNCGACDEIVRTGVNGFLVEPNNVAGYAFYMQLLHENEAIWKALSSASGHYAELGDVERFANGVIKLASIV
jgi:glycosyltransferase involved in cell wall biosynthesis